MTGGPQAAVEECRFANLLGRNAVIIVRNAASKGKHDVMGGGGVAVLLLTINGSVNGRASSEHRNQDH